MISVDKTIVVAIMPMNIGNSWYYAIGYAKNDKISTDVKARGATVVIEDHIKKYIMNSDVFFEDFLKDSTEGLGEESRTDLLNSLTLKNAFELEEL